MAIFGSHFRLLPPTTVLLQKLWRTRLHVRSGDFRRWNCSKSGGWRLRQVRTASPPSRRYCVSSRLILVYACSYCHVAPQEMDLGEEVQRVDESDTGDDELLSSPSSRISHGLLHEQMGTSQSMGHVQVPSSLGMHSSGTSEPEASMAMDGSIHQLHQLNQTDFQELPVLSLSQSRSIAQSLANRLLNVTTPMMTQTNILSLKRPPPLYVQLMCMNRSKN